MTGLGELKIGNNAAHFMKDLGQWDRQCMISCAGSIYSIYELRLGVVADVSFPAYVHADDLRVLTLL